VSSAQDRQKDVKHLVQDLTQRIHEVTQHSLPDDALPRTVLTKPGQIKNEDVGQTEAKLQHKLAELVRLSFQGSVAQTEL
jgi:hypothetical protein